MNAHVQRIVLAFAGDGDIAASIASLKARHGAELITMTLDLGQGRALEPVRDRAVVSGALRAHVLDVREEFAGDFILPALKADAVSEDGLPMSASLTQMLTARKLVEVAGMERATAVAHDASGSVVDRARLEAAIRSLDPALKMVATPRGTPFAIQQLDHARTVSTPLHEYPTEPAVVAITFERGVPVAVNGVNMLLLDLIGSLATIAGAHGLTPPFVLLHAAHQGLQKLVVPAELDRFSSIVGRQYAAMIDDGLWFTPLREALDGFVERVQERVTGTVRLELFKAGCRIVGCQSPFAIDLNPQDEHVVVGDS